jgi:hypothetical protein
MSVNLRYGWPIQDLAAVSQLQNMVANVPAILNGTLADPFVPYQISFISHRFIRGISITSANDLSANTFTVLGLQNGVPVTENITGPNATTVYGALSYDIVRSVTVNNNSNGVRIGTGDVGYIPLIQINNERPELVSWGLSVFLPLLPASGITYQGYLTLDNIYNNGQTFDSMIPTASGQLYNIIFENNTTSQYLPIIGINANYVLLQILSSTSPNTDTLYATFLQN